LNKIRRVAEHLVEQYPTLFSTDFDKNKQALSTVSIVHTRSLRNQLAGAITKLVRERGPLASLEVSGEIAPEEESTLEDRITAERGIEAPPKDSASGDQDSSSSSQRDNVSGHAEKKQDQQTIAEAAV
jgi:small subunit ribosomal protein S17e